MEPTAITHEKKGQRSEPNAHDYVPAVNLPGCSILNHQEFLCFKSKKFFCHPGLKVQYLEIFPKLPQEIFTQKKHTEALVDQLRS